LRIEFQNITENAAAVSQIFWRTILDKCRMLKEHRILSASSLNELSRIRPQAREIYK